MGTDDSSAREQVLTLQDGRKVGLLELGGPDGIPMFYFHGWPSSRLDAFWAADAASSQGVRLLSLDRPGIGLSDPSPGFTFEDWVRQVREVADLLGIGRFAVLGISSGAPYAFACARFLPDRLLAVGSVSGVGPLDLPNMPRYLYKEELRTVSFATRMPRVAGWLMRYELRNRDDDQKLLDSFGGANGPFAADVALFEADPTLSAGVGRMVRECVRQGFKGAIEDIAREGVPWSSWLPQIQTTVHVWQGEADGGVFPETARYFAAHLPNCVLTLYPGEGHFGPAVNHADEILGTLARRSKEVVG